MQMHAPISADAISHRRCPTTGKLRIHEKQECTPWGCTTRKYRALGFEIVVVFLLDVLSAVTQTILRDFSPAEHAYYIKKPRRGASIPPRTDASDNPLSASPRYLQSSELHGCSCPSEPGFGQRLVFMSHSRLRSRGVGLR